MLFAAHNALIRYETVEARRCKTKFPTDYPKIYLPKLNFLIQIVCNVAFHWLTSGFMQLAAAGCRRNMLHSHCHFEGKMLMVIIVY